MPPRTRRSAAAAAAAAALVADIQMDSEGEQEEDVDVEAEDEDEEQEVDDDDEPEPEEDVDEDGDGETDDDEPVIATPAQPRLKITLKLPVNTASSNGTDAETDYPAFKRTPKRRAKAKVIEDIDIESEDPTSPSESEAEQSISTPDVPTHSAGTPSGGTKSMTTRQAVLASVVDPTHVSLNEGTRSKKQPLNETELALRREETARKRKNLSEKKLEDEKAETINRLLKKQSRPKNKRTNTIDERSPMPAKPKNGEDDAEAEDEDDAMDVVEPPEEIKPIMYRWVSSLREIPNPEGGQKVEMGLTFSIPEHVVPLSDLDVKNRASLEKIRAATGPGICAVKGCGKSRKYRFTKDWTIGACDWNHLRILESINKLSGL